MNKNKKWVFAVDQYETSSDKHDVSYGIGDNYKTEEFDEWDEAELFANQKAIEMGLKEYQIDTPENPHVMIKVTKSDELQGGKQMEEAQEVIDNTDFIEVEEPVEQQSDSNEKLSIGIELPKMDLEIDF